jgi:RNA ligase
MSDSPKYNRTYHLPWSEGAMNDDKIASSVSSLLNTPIVITEKIDGGNCSWETDGLFARTHANAPTHPAFDPIKALYGAVKYKIPSDAQLFGEACYAKHSIYYDRLPGYFLLFGVRDLGYDPWRWTSWDGVKYWADQLDIPTVPVLFEGQVFSEKELRQITDDLMGQPSVYGDQREGVVVRIRDAFNDDQFSECVMKRVRKDHIDPDNDHWMHQSITPNKLGIKT